MTIKYLDSKRISGLSSDTKPTSTTVQTNSLFTETNTGKIRWSGNNWGWDYEDDYSSYTTQAEADAVWDKNVTNVQVNITNDNLAFTSNNVSANWSIANNLANRASLPATLSDTAWVNRSTVNFTTIVTSDGCGVSYCFFGLSSINKSNSSTAGVAEDFLGWSIQANNFKAWERDNGFLNGGTGSNIITGITTGIRYIEMTRLSSTSFKAESFANSNYTSSQGSATITVGSTIQSLQYAAWRKMDNTGVCGATPTVGTIDDFKISSGVTVAP